MLTRLACNDKGRLVSAALLAQALSLLIALTGTFSTLLVEQGVSLPAFQSVINYATLGLVNGGLLAWQRAPLKIQWYKYAALALLDVQGNFCLVLSYRYTSITSVTLLDCFTIPVVLLLSWFFLSARYRPSHWLGALLCLGGLVLLVFTDRAFSGRGKYSNPLLGDFLVLLGASLYGACNVAQERLLGDAGRIEVLAMLGAFGTLWGSILAVILERKAIFNTKWTAQVVMPFLGFNAALFSFSSLVPYVLLWSGAAMLNLSLLSSDLWAALSRIALFGGFDAASAFYFAVSFTLVAAGLIMYTTAGDIYTAHLSVQPSTSNTEDLQHRNKPPEEVVIEDANGEDSDSEAGALLLNARNGWTPFPAHYAVHDIASGDASGTSVDSSELELGMLGQGPGIGLANVPSV